MRSKFCVITLKSTFSRAENVANLAKHFVNAHIGAGVARAVVAGEEQFEFFAGLPALAAAEHPLQAGEFDAEG